MTRPVTALAHSVAPHSILVTYKREHLIWGLTVIELRVHNHYDGEHGNKQAGMELEQ